MTIDERRYKFFTVQCLPTEPGRKTPRYAILNNRSGNLLGIIEWYGPWRQFCFFPEAGTVWSNGCLAGVQDAIKRATLRSSTSLRSTRAEQRRTGE